MLLAVPGLKEISNFEDSLSAIAILFDLSALDFGKCPPYLSLREVCSFR